MTKGRIDGKNPSAMDLADGTLLVLHHVTRHESKNTSYL